MKKNLCSLLMVFSLIFCLQNISFADGFLRDFRTWGGGKVGFGVVIDETNLNVRSGPGTEYDVLEEVPYGAVLWLPKGAPNREIGSGWVLISGEHGERGYVSGNLLETAKVYSIDNLYGSLYGMVNSDASNIRLGASTKCPIQNVVDAGTKVMIRASGNGWYFIISEDRKHGWISQNYVDLTGEINRTPGFNFF